MTYNEVKELLFKESPSFQNSGIIGYQPGLKKMWMFDDFLKSPHLYYPIIHIAGTNGKGSTAHILAAILADAGYKTGLYTSPHLNDFRERMKIVEGDSFEMIREEDVVYFWEKSKSFITKYKPSFFEITTAMAFDWFRKSQVDIAIIETGLGGRLDSTNIITPLLSIITSIGFDHRDILGSTINEIAREKGGIIKFGVPVVLGVLEIHAFGEIYGISKNLCSPLVSSRNMRDQFEQEKSLEYRILSISPEVMDLKADVMTVNLQTIASAIRVLRTRFPLELNDSAIEAVKHAARRTGLHGRWETLNDKPLVLCDIGHNEDALKYTMPQLKKMCEERHSNLKMVYGMAADKEIAEISSLLPEDAKYYFTNAAGTRALQAEMLKKIITKNWKGDRSDAVTSSVREAVEAALSESSEDDTIFIGGSSYVVAEALPMFLK